MFSGKHSLSRIKSERVRFAEQYNLSLVDTGEPVRFSVFSPADDNTKINLPHFYLKKEGADSLDYLLDVALLQNPDDKGKVEYFQRFRIGHDGTDLYRLFRLRKQPTGKWVSTEIDIEAELPEFRAGS